MGCKYLTYLIIFERCQFNVTYCNDGLVAFSVNKYTETFVFTRIKCNYFVNMPCVKPNLSTLTRGDMLMVNAINKVANEISGRL